MSTTTSSAGDGAHIDISIYDTENPTRFSEDYIQNSFHRYLKSSLTQAKAEKLLDEDVLSSAVGDLMITGPALCLYFAALRSTTSPPSVPLPRHTANAAPMELSQENCPPAFIRFLSVWTKNVAAIKSLAPEYQHDLARVICNLEPTKQPLNPSLDGIAAELRAVAIEISQRRSFQDRYAGDLQAALDAGDGGGKRYKASFVPPPVYDPSPTGSPIWGSGSGPGSGSGFSSPAAGNSPSSPACNLPTAGILPPSPGLLSAKPWPPRSPSPMLFLAESPAIEIIRETLYASLGDVLDRTPSLRRLSGTDAPRAYFGGVGLAIVDVATTSMTAEGGVVGVLGKELRVEDCPAELRPFMIELGAIGREAKVMEEEDTAVAMRCAERGEEVPAARMDVVRKMLEVGIGEGGGEVVFANRINGMSLGMTRLTGFRERVGEAFAVLGGM